MSPTPPTPEPPAPHSPDAAPPPEAWPWRQGWLAAARHCPSPNFGPRPPGEPISLIVVHAISLPPGVWGSGDIERLFTNTLDWDSHPYHQRIRGLQVSAHFLIARDGALTQFVSVSDRAWHAGSSSWRGRANCNDYSIGIELEGLDDHPFEAIQYHRLRQLCRALRAHWPLRTVVGHQHIAPGRKTDPGSGFDWGELAPLAPALEIAPLSPLSPIESEAQSS